MIDFLNRLFGRHTSGATAKERLRLVLMTDHLSLAPEMVESMKRDLVDVISRYVEVDRERIEVNFEEKDKALAMLANIPILSVNRPAPPEPPAAPPPKKPRRRRKRAASTASAPSAGAAGNPAPAT